MVERGNRKTGGRGFDPIAMEVFSNRLLSITEDMGNTLIRSSFSTNIKERKDCSVGLFDRCGRLIAQGSHVPLHLGSLMGGVESVLDRYPLDRMHEGDAFICNDPYLAGGTHMPDVSIVTPVFWNHEVCFFTANIGHHSDFGGSVPGSIAAGSRTVFEEGLRIPAIRIVHRGRLDEDLLHMIVNNTRVPEERTLDLKVQIATNERGAALARDLVARTGIRPVERMVEDILAYTRRRLANRVRALKDGHYEFTRYLDDDGQGGDPVPLHVAVVVKGDTLTVDFTGSGPQARGAMNVAPSALNATVYYCVKALLDPELMPNSGMFDAIRIVAPVGTITNPRPPAAVGARSITCNKIAGAIFGALAGVLPPERVLASGNDNVPSINFSGQLANGRGTFVYGETIGGGSGAGHDRDGMDTVHVHITNTSNLPTEALENEYPLLVDAYALVEDSCGPGRFRGGCGLTRQISSRVPGIITSVRSDSHLMGAPGVFGGGTGGLARLIRNHGERREQVLASKIAHVELEQGESIRLETAGAGGFGRPADRPLSGIARDLRNGVQSRAAAERNYGKSRVAAAMGQA